MTLLTSVLRFYFNSIQKSESKQVIHLIEILLLGNTEQLSKEAHHSLSTLSTIPVGDGAFVGDNDDDDNDDDEEEDGADSCW